MATTTTTTTTSRHIQQQQQQQQITGAPLDAPADCTIACDKGHLTAHKLLLCAHSKYLQDILSKHPTAEHPIVILTELNIMDIKILVNYMYTGELVVTSDTSPTSLLRAAQILKIDSLTDDVDRDNASDNNLDLNDDDIVDDDVANDDDDDEDLDLNLNLNLNHQQQSRNHHNQHHRNHHSRRQHHNHRLNHHNHHANIQDEDEDDGVHDIQNSSNNLDMMLDDDGDDDADLDIQQDNNTDIYDSHVDFQDFQTLQDLQGLQNSLKPSSIDNKNNKIRCHLCNIGLSDVKCLYRHVLTRHLPEKWGYKCEFCDREFSRDDHLMRHYTTKHKNMEFDREKIRETRRLNREMAKNFHDQISTV